MTAIPFRDPQQLVDRLVAAREAPAPDHEEVRLLAATAEPFSSFDPVHVAEAAEVAVALMRSAQEDGDLAAALDQAAQARPGVAEYATKLFLTHYPPARDLLVLLPLEYRQPRLVLPSRTPLEEPEAPEPGGASPPEDVLEYWREDPLLNEHHEHWHLVYPLSGRPGPGGVGGLGDRHGELFAYMHEQMLARYDAERLSTGLDRVTPFDDYHAGVPQGYDPGPLLLWDGQHWSPFGARPDDAGWSDLTGNFATRPGARVDDMVTFAGNLLLAATAGTYKGHAAGHAVTADNLGDTAEANTGSVDDLAKTTYGNHHNDGHVHWMAYDNTTPYGVMGQTATAVRDPIFWRWHKQVDSHFHAFRDAQEPYDPSEAPPLRLDPGGVSLEVAGDSGWRAADTLTTRMLERQVELRSPTGDPVLVPIRYLACDDFRLGLVIGNDSGAAQEAAVRAFFVPEAYAEDRAAWIELDRFKVRVPAGGTTVWRRSDESAVVRKPVKRPADLEPTDEPDSLTDMHAWCDCGWPYTLLLPRGTPGGMPFLLAVFLTPGDDLDLPPEAGEQAPGGEHGVGDGDACSSISYCGLKDRTYPDRRPMGYPFCRPFPGPVQQVVESGPASALRSFRIAHVPFAP